MKKKVAEQLVKEPRGEGSRKTASFVVFPLFLQALGKDRTRTNQNARKQPSRSATLTSDSGIAAAALGQDFTE